MAGEFVNFKGTDKIYRYLDFVKLSDILLNQHLFFSRADIQNDKFEGQLGNINILQRKYMTDSADLNEHTEEDFSVLQRMFLLSCWHMGTIESFAMWKIYAGDNHCVDIETTIDDLLHSIRYSNEDVLKKIPMAQWGKEIFLSNNIQKGSVDYYDWKGKYIPDQFSWNYRRFLCKLENFEYEKEFRLIIDGERLLTMLNGSREEKCKELISDNGFCHVGECIPVDVENLIKKIIICPTAGEWFKSLVANLLTASGFQNIKVEQSCLDRSPTF